MPGTWAADPEAPAVMSHVAFASVIVWRAIVYVALAVAACVGCSGPAAGGVTTGRTGGCSRGQTAGGLAPLIHVRTALTAQPDGSAVTVLWPTPGTIVSLPCGNRATTDCALAVGVRMSMLPLTAIIGTSGSG